MMLTWNGLPVAGKGEIADIVSHIQVLPVWAYICGVWSEMESVRDGRW